jgi:hypothetical protein
MLQEVFKYQSYQSDFDNYLPEDEQFRPKLKFRATQIRFVVAWQLENEEESEDDRTNR